MSGLFGGGSSKGGSTSTTVRNVSSVSLPPWMDTIMSGNAQKAQTMSQQPFQSWTGASFTPTNDTQNAATAVTKGLTGYQPQQVAAGQMTGGNVFANGGGQSIAGTDLSAYMNPYLHQVLDSQTAIQNQQGAIQQQQLMGTLGQQGAFGGDRTAVAQSQLAGQQALANNSANSKTLSDAFMAALAAGQFDVGQRNSQATTQAQLDQSTGSTNLAAQQQAALANQQAGLQGAGVDLSAAQQMFSQGTVAQASADKGLDFDKQQFFNSVNDPYNKLQWSQGIASGIAPVYGTQNSSTTSPGPSAYAQAVGGATAATGVLGLFSGGSNSAASGIGNMFAAGGEVGGDGADHPADNGWMSPRLRIALERISARPSSFADGGYADLGQYDDLIPQQPIPASTFWDRLANIRGGQQPEVTAEAAVPDALRPKVGGQDAGFQVMPAPVPQAAPQAPVAGLGAPMQPAAIGAVPAPGSVPAQAGLDSLAGRVAQVETGGRDDAVNPHSTARGRLQITDGMWRTFAPKLGYSDADRTNPRAQEGVFAAFREQEMRQLPAVLGRTPTDADIYTSWGAGPGAMRAFARAGRDADAYATYRSVAPGLADQAFANNPGLLQRGMTVGQVMDAYAGRLAGAGGGAPAAGDDQRPGAAPPAVPGIPAGAPVAPVAPVPSPVAGSAPVAGLGAPTAAPPAAAATAGAPPPLSAGAPMPRPVAAAPAAVAVPVPAQAGLGAPAMPARSAAVAGLGRPAAVPVDPEIAALAESRRQAPFLALINAGGAMMASRSPHFMGALGEGVQAGANSYQTMRNQDTTVASHAADRRQRGRELDVRMAETREGRQDTLRVRLAEAAQRAEDRSLDREARERATREAADLRRQLSTDSNETRLEIARSRPGPQGSLDERYRGEWLDLQAKAQAGTLTPREQAQADWIKRHFEVERVTTGPDGTVTRIPPMPLPALGAPAGGAGGGGPAPAGAGPASAAASITPPAGAGGPPPREGRTNETVDLGGGRSVTTSRPLQELPAQQREELAKDVGQLGTLDGTIRELAGARGHVGPLIGNVPEFARQWVDPDGTKIRALVSRLSAIEIHEKAGAAQSAAEVGRLRPYIPLITDRPQVIAEKLAMFQQEYRNMLRERVATFDTSRIPENVRAALGDPAVRAGSGSSTTPPPPPGFRIVTPGG